MSKSHYNLPIKYKAEFMGIMEAMDSDDLPDGAWWCVLEDTAQEFLENHNITSIDSNSAVHYYLSEREKDIK